MKNYVVFSMLLIVLAPVFGVDYYGGTSNDSSTNETDTQNHTETNYSDHIENHTVFNLTNFFNGSNKEELKSQIQDMLDSMNKTRINVSGAEVNISNGEVDIEIEKEDLTISIHEVTINGITLVNETTPARISINVTINTAQGNRTVNIIREDNQVMLNSSDELQVNISLNNNLRLVNNTLYLNVTGVERQIAVLPAQAASMINASHLSIRSMNLTIEGARAVYKISEERQARLLGFIPVSLSVDSSIDATSGVLVSVQRPWWSFLAVE